MLSLTSLARLILLAPLWYGFGKLSSKALRIPLITGFIAAGVLSGPSCLGLLDASELAVLQTIEHACLSLIALAAGAELQLAELRHIRAQVIYLTLSISIFSWAAVFVAGRVLLPLLPFAQNLTLRETLAITSLLATLAVARSPASAIAVLQELDGRGPYCSLVMAVIVTKDVLVFILFALTIEAGKALQLSTTTASPSGIRLLQEIASPFLGVLSSGALGCSMGVALSQVLQGRAAKSSSSSSSLHPRSSKKRLLLTFQSLTPFLASTVTFFLAEYMQVEPLLGCVCVGLVVGNSSLEGSDAGTVLARDVSRLFPVLNTIFFGLVGASIKLSAIGGTISIAAALFTARLIGIWVGCYLGGIASGTPPRLQKFLWQGMMTQAGIALGLAKVVSTRFSDTWGQDFAALAAGIIVANLLVGPLLFKAAIISLKEAGTFGAQALEYEIVARTIPVIDEHPG